MTPEAQGRWITTWNPEDPDFWARTGRRTAIRNLVFSVFAEHLGFLIWLLWSVVVLSLPAAGFSFTVDQLFWLVAVPNLVGSTLRLPYTFAVTRFGGRNWTVVSALLLLIPTTLLALAVSNANTPFWAFVLVAATAGLGGGNFASSMTNISFFFPERRKGFALGLNAAGGNLGTSVVQFAVPTFVALGAGISLAFAGLMWMPFILAAAICAWLFMDNLKVAQTPIRQQLAAIKRPQTWVMSFLYIGTFGSFVGYTAAFPLLIKNEFPDAKGLLAIAFLGALIGSLIRPVGGWLADKIGGARVTLGVFAVMIVGMVGLLVAVPDPLARPVPRLVRGPVRLGRYGERLDVPDDPRDLPRPGREGGRGRHPRRHREGTYARRRLPRHRRRDRGVRRLPHPARVRQLDRRHRRGRHGRGRVRGVLRRLLRRHLVVLPAPAALRRAPAQSCRSGRVRTS